MTFPTINSSYQFCEKEELNKSCPEKEFTKYYFNFHFDGWCFECILRIWSKGETSCYFSGHDCFFLLPFKIPVNDENPVEMLKTFEKYYKKLELLNAT